MTNEQMNYQALANTARECASIANSVSGTMKWIVNHWNLCCQQAGLINFTTEARYTRRAALAADMLRMAEQLDNLANGRDAITGETIEQRTERLFERGEAMVQDIRIGMTVINPVSGEHNIVRSVDDFSAYFIISFSGDMVQQYFDRGETLIVCEPIAQAEPDAGSQITEVSITPNEENAMTVSITNYSVAPNHSVLYFIVNDFCHWKSEGEQVDFNIHEECQIIGTASTQEEADMIIDAFHAEAGELAPHLSQALQAGREIQEGMTFEQITGIEPNPLEQAAIEMDLTPEEEAMILEYRARRDNAREADLNARR